MKLLETEWISFRDAVLPRDAPSTQLREMRRAFYAGAWAYYSLVMNRLSRGEEETAEDLSLMAKLHDEMVEFTDRVKKGWA